MRRRIAAAAIVGALLPLPPATAAIRVASLPAAAQVALDEPTVTAKGAVLYDAADDRMLWGAAADAPLPPASTTKIMTVLLALEAGTVDDTVTVSAAAAEVGRRPGAATLGLDPGEQVPMRSLLEGLVLRSGNDAAVAVAEHVAGSEDAFVKRMNARAAELGMTDTNFLNATGLTDDLAHHASALDLARLADVALGNADFARWAATASAVVPQLGTLVNRNELLGSYPGANGVKTGYTNLAGLCLVASAERDGRPLIVVVLGSDASFSDSVEIFDYGYSAYRRPMPVIPGERVVRYRWADAAVALTGAEDLARTVRADRDASWHVQLDPYVERPVSRGDVLGSAELTVNGAVVDSTDLVARSDAGVAPDRPPAATAGAAVQEALRAFALLQPIDRSVDG